MKRLKLKCIEKTQPQPIDCVAQFNKELDEYCKKPEKETTHYKWYHTKDTWPPNKNEDILIFNQNGNYEIVRSFSTVQNLVYRTKVMGITDRTEFYWMRIKTPTGKPQYDS